MRRGRVVRHSCRCCWLWLRLWSVVCVVCGPLLSSKGKKGHAPRAQRPSKSTPAPAAPPDESQTTQDPQKTLFLFFLYVILDTYIILYKNKYNKHQHQQQPARGGACSGCGGMDGGRGGGVESEDWCRAKPRHKATVKQTGSKRGQQGALSTKNRWRMQRDQRATGKDRDETTEDRRRARPGE
jgi:hypothetical protein